MSCFGLIYSFQFISDGECEKISDGTKLIKTFLVRGYISYCPDGLENLSESLKDIRRHDLSGEIIRFIDDMKKTSDHMQEKGKGEQGFIFNSKKLQSIFKREQTVILFLNSIYIRNTQKIICYQGHKKDICNMTS